MIFNLTAKKICKLKQIIILPLKQQRNPHVISYRTLTAGHLQATLLSKLLKPKFHYADFHRNFSAGKLRWSFGESRRHKARKSRTQIMKRGSFGLAFAPNSITPTFTETSPKLPRGEVSVKVGDTNHESRGHKSWSFGLSAISTCRDGSDKVRDKSVTNPFVSL